MKTKVSKSMLSINFKNLITLFNNRAKQVKVWKMYLNDCCENLHSHYKGDMFVASETGNRNDVSHLAHSALRHLDCIPHQGAFSCSSCSLLSEKNTSLTSVTKRH